MVTDKTIKTLERLSTFGSDYMFDNEELKANKFNFKKRLRDFSDQEVMEVLKTKPNSAGEVFYKLMKSVEDKDIHAHIYGFESMKAMDDEIMRLIKDTVD